MPQDSHNKGQYTVLLLYVICKWTVAYASQCRRFLFAVFSNNSWSASAAICGQSVPKIWYWTVLTAKLHSKFLSYRPPNHSWTHVHSWHTWWPWASQFMYCRTNTSCCFEAASRFIWVAFILSVLLPICFLHDTNDFKEHPHILFSHFFSKLLTLSQKLFHTLDHLWCPSL